MTKMQQLSLDTSKNITKSLTLISTAATAMAASVIGSFAAMTEHAQDFSFEIAKFAEKTGTTVEVFSKLAFSAKEAGVPLDMLKGAMERLARTSFAAQNGQKEAVQAYTALGISAKDLQGPLRDSGSLLVAVSKKLEGMSDSTRKTGLEQKILGRTGSELAPMLRQLATGFDTASQKAELFGVVVGDRAADNARKLHESMVQLESVALGFSLRLLQDVSPALQDVAEQIVQVATSADGMRLVGEISRSLAEGVHAAGDAFVFLSEHSTAVKRTLEGLAALQLGSIFVPMIASAAKAGPAVDSVGLVGLKMISRLTGITQLGKVFVPLITGAYATIPALLSLAATEGVLASGAYGMELAFAALSAPLLALTGSIAILTAGLGLAAYEFVHAKNAAADSLGYAVTWAEAWGGAMDYVGDKMLKFIEINNSIPLTPRIGGVDALIAQMESKGGSRSLEQAMKARAEADNNGITNYGNGVSTRGHKGHEGYIPQVEAPTLPKDVADKVDRLALKMAELRVSAQAAMQSLADAGKGVDFERADEIAKEFNKTLVEQERGLKKLSPAERSLAEDQIYLDVATRINSLSQAKFKDEAIKSTQQILAQAAAHVKLAGAVDQGAAAVRRATVESEFSTQLSGKSEQWIRANKDAIDQQKAARYAELAAADKQSDRAAIGNVQAEINAQMALTKAILQGKDARDEANLANEQAGIRKQFADRGDTDTDSLEMALAKNAELFSIKQKQADLNKAASLDPARAYLEEASALTAAASAASELGNALSLMQIKAANKANWEQYVSAIDKVTLSVGTASDGVSVFFEQMSREAASSAQQVHDVLSNTFQSLNGMLDKLIQGQKVSFAEFFRGIAGQIGQLSIQKGEQALAGGLLKSLGVGTKADPNTSQLVKSNETLVQILDVLKSKSPDANGSLPGIDGLLKSIPSNAGASGIGSALTPFLSLLPGVGPFASLFGGHLALGGDVTAGMSYDVGEMGREKFVAPANGKIVRNDGGKGTAYYAIDARGANEEAVNQRVRSSLAAVHESAVRTSISQVQEGVRRRPRSARF